MVNFTRQTLTKEGTLQAGDVSYSVTLTAIDGVLTRLHCNIAKKEREQHVQVGYISLDHGRQHVEVAQGENLIPHLTKFQEILDEVLGSTPTT